jgi:hypothetical protein
VLPLFYAQFILLLVILVLGVERVFFILHLLIFCFIWKQLYSERRCLFSYLLNLLFILIYFSIVFHQFFNEIAAEILWIWWPLLTWWLLVYLLWFVMHYIGILFLLTFRGWKKFYSSLHCSDLLFFVFCLLLLCM